ncbi:imidazole glycerol phosphate synthase subunit HisH [Desulfothermus okinawensis JCM 13304]
MIAIIDYLAGNLTSVKRSLDFLGIESEITDDPKKIGESIGIIFPGVGAAGSAMKNLISKGLDQILKREASKGKPLLGICLGSQIILDFSEENSTECLGLIPGKCIRFSDSLKDETGNSINIPHMGWNQVYIKEENPLFEGIENGMDFYFVHGYYPFPHKEYVLGTTTYGIEFCSVLGKEPLWAVQFHPEKSGRFGLKILENFYRFCKKN